ncbi:hypothetical protein HD554DRAFT_1160324 [Boletus coccyginus]|nr:hypothetical protein HD554DRAFT_1160324 [Boletus coccyginus]
MKVADCGLAKVVDSHTFWKTMCGTPSYLALEVVMRSDQQPDYSHLVDSWGVGVIVLSMLTSASSFEKFASQSAPSTGVVSTTLMFLSSQRISFGIFLNSTLVAICLSAARLSRPAYPRRRWSQRPSRNLRGASF